MNAGLSPSEHAEVVRWASHWSQRWFAGPDGEDRFRVGMIEAGWATHVEGFLILLDLASEHIGAARRRPSLRRWIKQRGLDRGLRSAALRRRGDGAKASEAQVAAIVEIPTPSMTDPCAMVMAAAGSDAALGVTDPRAGTRAAAAFGATWSPVVLARIEERACLRASAPALRAAWAAVAADPPEMLLDGVDLGPAALRRLSPLVKRSMPHLAAEETAVERFLIAARPASVALASDQHRIGRVTVAVARRLGIPSVVLQHGLPQAPIGYLPVVADRVAAWSAASRDWFLEAGTPSGSVVVVGNPRADALRIAATPLDGRRQLLLALSPTATATNDALVGLVLDAVAKLERCTLTIKLHPGAGDWSFVARLVGKHRAADRVDVRRHDHLGPLLGAASVVVVHRSSVAIDALAAGRPVVIVRAGSEPTTADLELAALNLPVYHEAGELAAAILDLTRPEAAQSYFAERDEAILSHVGPQGGSVDRILRFMRAGAG